MKKTGFFLMFLLLFLLCSCEQNAETAMAEPSELTDSEILRTQHFYFEGTQDYLGVQIYFKAKIVGPDGNIIITAGKKEDTYTICNGNIYQELENGESANITQTAAGESLSALIEKLCSCPNVNDTSPSEMEYSFSEDGKKLLHIKLNNIVITVTNIEYLSHASAPSS